MKKAAVMIYPNFSLQEITTLTLLFMLEKKEVVVFASEQKPYVSEDKFIVLPHKTYEEFREDEFDVLILPGIFGFKEAFEDWRNIEFLQSLKNANKLLIASISSSPILLAKAGLLEQTTFCSGLYEEAFEIFDFLPKENIIRKPLVKDGRIITAMGFAYREFAIVVANSLGMKQSPDRFSGIRHHPPYTDEELTFYSPK